MAPWASNMMHPLQNMTTHNKIEKQWHNELVMWCILYKIWQHITTMAQWAINVIHPVQNKTEQQWHNEILGLVDESQNIVLQWPNERFYVYLVLCERIFLRNQYYGKYLTSKNCPKIKKIHLSLQRAGIGKSYRI